MIVEGTLRRLADDDGGATIWTVSPFNGQPYSFVLVRVDSNGVLYALDEILKGEMREIITPHKDLYLNEYEALRASLEYWEDETRRLEDVAYRARRTLEALRTAWRIADHLFQHKVDAVAK